LDFFNLLDLANRFPGYLRIYLSVPYLLHPEHFNPKPHP